MSNNLNICCCLQTDYVIKDVLHMWKRGLERSIEKLRLNIFIGERVSEGMSGSGLVRRNSAEAWGASN